MTLIRTRIAPTPSGLLHIGNAYNFILTWWYARYYKGVVGLRIDDFDQARFRQEYLEDIFETLDWMKMGLDFGPKSSDEFLLKHSQQLKKEKYEGYLERVSLFSCECSRKEVQKNLVDGAYAGTCLSKGLRFKKRSHALRLKSEKEDLYPKELRSMILWTKDDFASYQLASVIDDYELGINLLIRGEDLAQSTKAQSLLSKELGLRPFPKAFHHSLIKGDDGEKLSKSRGSTSLKSFRDSELSLKDLLSLWESDWGFRKGELSSLNDLLEHDPLERLTGLNNVTNTHSS